jgi:hypothetical protein
MWPRFTLEAAFLVAVAIAAGALGLSTAAIVAVMVVAYLCVVAVEWTAAQTGRREAPAVAVDWYEPEPEPEPEVDDAVADASTSSERDLDSEPR